MTSFLPNTTNPNNKIRYNPFIMLYVNRQDSKGFFTTFYHRKSFQSHCLIGGAMCVVDWYHAINCRTCERRYSQWSDSRQFALIGAECQEVKDSRLGTLFYTGVQVVVLCIVQDISKMSIYQGKCLQFCFKYASNAVTGVFSKPSGNLIVAPIFCFWSQRLQIMTTCLFF